MPTKKISFIIVNYNTRDILLKCIENLGDVWPNKELIVVDNGSSDGSAEAIEQLEDQRDLRLIKTANNGLAAAHNLGIKAAAGDYICYLGTDAFPNAAAIQKIFGFMELSEKAGIVTPKLVLRDGSIDWDAHRGFPTPWAALTHFSKINKLFPSSKLFNRYFLGWESFDSPHEIDVCISHFMFTKREVLDKVGLWDETFFVFGEDVDFCYRVKQAGYKIFYLPGVEVLHYKGASIGRKSSRDIKTAASSSLETRLRMAKASTTAMKIFYQKHYSEVYPKGLTGIILGVINLMQWLRVTKVRYFSK